MQSGVIIEFMDSLGIEVFYIKGINIKNDKSDGVDYNIYIHNEVRFSGHGASRLKAIQNSISKVEEFYNDGIF